MFGWLKNKNTIKFMKEWEEFIKFESAWSL